MRVVRFLIQPIWSRRESRWAMPRLVTVLPAAAASLPVWVSQRA